MSKDTHALESMGLDSGQQLEFYRILVNSIKDYAIFLMDTGGHIASWNLGAELLKGYKPEEIIGSHFSRFYPEKDVVARKPERELEICNQYGRVEDEGWRIRKDGSRFWANVVITSLRDRSGTHIGYAKVTRDLTERKRHEDNLRDANKVLRGQQAELEKLNQSKDEFISLASHQLRTPATGVKQFLGLVLEGYAGELSNQQEDYVRRAYDSNNRQIDLVNNLLRVAQVDAGKVTLNKSGVDLAALIKDVVDEQIDSFKDRRQKLTLDIPNECFEAAIDSMRFRMVLENLIDNASKYTPPNGKISISLKSVKGMAEIAIADNGVGIEADSLPKLFSKFSRIPNQLSETVGGSGLGLYWAHKIVKLHGGSIDVSSHPDEGTTFTICIPRKPLRA